MNGAFTVYYDGGCPLCRREIAWYRSREGAADIRWIDVSRAPCNALGEGLSRDAALGRFHVRLAEGRLLSGARAFTALWTCLSGLRLAGRLMGSPMLAPLLEGAYRVLLWVRPRLLSPPGRAERAGGDVAYPRWFEPELRCDHAGESGAVAIYRGILAVGRDASLREFAAQHLQTEERHLEQLERLLPRARRSRLLPLWRCAGFAAGALPALVGARAVHVTIDAVESFVERHYAAQIRSLPPGPGCGRLRAVLERCRADEIAHRDEARLAAGMDRNLLERLWVRAVTLGSVIGVRLARRI